MATAKKKSTGGKRTASSSRSSSSRTTSSRKKPAPRPVRREVGAVVCLLLAIFAALGYFHIQAIFIDFFCGLVKGLIGYGYLLLPPMLLVASGILAFHRGRPVRLRVWCALLLPVLAGGFFHLLLAQGAYAWDMKLPELLWTQGQALTSGGVVSGVAALGLTAVFSKIGAGIIFVLLAVILVMVCFHISPTDVVDKVRSRPEYEEEEIPEPRPRRKRAEPEHEPVRESRRQQPQIDIPVDDGPLVGKKREPKPIEKKERFFNRKPSVPTPDQVLTGNTQAQPEEAEVPEEEALPFAAPAEIRHEAVQPQPVAQPEPEPVPEPQPVPQPAPMPEIVREPAVPPTSAKARQKEETAQAAAEVAQDIARTLEEEPMAYQYPPVSLLTEGEGVSSSDVAGELRANQARLSDTIRSFGIDASISNVTRGPSVTRYELELDQGVRLNKLTNLADDIALALGATGVRIAPIPNQISMVGIEVPNRLVSPVYIHDVIDSKEFRDNPSKVSFAVGKDIGGNNIVGNIAKLPHLLIAGTTGSGKSVCMNSIIISLLYKAKPEEVKLIMVDPKMVELGIYNGIPHLLIPVVTDPKKAAGSLQWAVTEMMRRYKIMSDAGVRDLESFNRIMDSSGEEEPLPQIVVIIDELADLMLVAAKEVEESICRIAQMGRAAGMHLIIATQRPSADVITGLMKANIPSRIAFAVASAMESRIILDTQGAEKLVGRGDMLYAPLGKGKPKRIQGCFVSDAEVEAVAEFVKEHYVPDYSQEVLEEIERKAEQSGKGGKSADSMLDFESEDAQGDEMLPAAVDVILETGQASVSMLQRRLKLGYARAARIVDEMEERGIVGPFMGSKPRNILITKEQWQQMQSGQLPLEELTEEESADSILEETPESYL